MLVGHKNKVTMGRGKAIVGLVTRWKLCSMINDGGTFVWCRSHEIYKDDCLTKTCKFQWWHHHFCQGLIATLLPTPVFACVGKCRLKKKQTNIKSQFIKSCFISQTMPIGHWRRTGCRGCSSARLKTNKRTNKKQNSEVKIQCPGIRVATQRDRIREKSPNTSRTWVPWAHPCEEVTFILESQFQDDDNNKRDCAEESGAHATASRHVSSLDRPLASCGRGTRMNRPGKTLEERRENQNTAGEETESSHQQERCDEQNASWEQNRRRRRSEPQETPAGGEETPLGFTRSTKDSHKYKVKMVIDK